MKNKFTPIRIIAIILIVTLTVYFREYMNIIIPIWLAIIATYVALTMYARNVFDTQRAAFDRETEEYILRLEEALKDGSKDTDIEPRKTTDLQLIKNKPEEPLSDVIIPPINTGHGNKKIWHAKDFDEATRNIDAVLNRL